MAENIISAKAGEGTGTHILAFGDDNTVKDGIELSVPGKTTKYAEKYSTSLTCTLADVPGQEKEKYMRRHCDIMQCLLYNEKL
ncbi:WxL domain-containing protein [Bacillus toyonensis]|nr:WxL domain-containing protein [Bacillus toyonensis]PEW47753.1 WxL domain-containing protein [Bacillus cereus]PHG74834.1 WxL domain-containing protein [Bacillus wiedmannii]KAB2379567.1 WxL domain-containing protein [Bacillus toyonensis]PEB15136.1 WxL domain-containing protein [Bacillus toyonensis]